MTYVVLILAISALFCVGSFFWNLHKFKKAEKEYWELVNSEKKKEE